MKLLAFYVLYTLSALTLSYTPTPRTKVTSTMRTTMRTPISPPPLPRQLPQSRSTFLRTLSSTLPILIPFSSSALTPTAIGSAERTCRQNGNCLETLNLDGALGFNWGGADRCDARDPDCRVDGKLAGEEFVDMSVPGYLDEVYKVGKKVNLLMPSHIQQTLTHIYI